MERIVRVRTVHDDGTADVTIVRESACSGDCHRCAGCGAASEVLTVRAVNAVGARPGELVKMVSDSAPVLKAAAIVYLVPFVLFFAGYFLGGALAACALFALGIGLAVGYDRLVLRRQKESYTLVAYNDSP